MSRRWALRGLFALGCALLVAMPALQLCSLHSTLCDMGIYANIYWALSNGQWGRLFFGHAVPLLALYHPFWLLFPDPLTLVLLQSAALVAGFVLAARLGAAWNLPAWLTPLAYLAFFPIWFNALFDFHPDHMAIPLGLAFFLLARTGRWRLAALAALLLCLVKEPYALCGVCCGPYIWLRGKRPALGLVVSALSLGYLLFAVFVAIPTYTYSTSNFATGMATSLPKSALGFASNLPELLLAKRKWFYLLLLFGGLGFLPAFAPLELLPAMPLVAGTLLVSNPNYYSHGHQYTAGFVAPLLVAFAAVASRLGLGGPGRRGATVSVVGCMLAVHALFSPSPLSRFFVLGNVWKYCPAAYIPTPRDSLIKQTIDRYIPADPHAVVSSQNSVFYAPLARRDALFAFPDGVFSPQLYPYHADGASGRWFQADYVVVDLKRPWYLGQDGCSWLSGSPVTLTAEELAMAGVTEPFGPLPWIGCLDPAARRAFLSTLQQTRNRYTLRYAHDGFMIFGPEQ